MTSQHLQSQKENPLQLVKSVKLRTSAISFIPKYYNQFKLILYECIKIILVKDNFFLKLNITYYSYYTLILLQLKLVRTNNSPSPRRQPTPFISLLKTCYVLTWVEYYRLNCYASHNQSNCESLRIRSSEVDFYFSRANSLICCKYKYIYSMEKF